MNFEPLTTIAEVAVAFAGFASVVVVFGDRGRRGLPLVYRIATRGMLLCSLTVVFAAFVPFLIAKFNQDTSQIWGWSCITFAGICLVLLAAAIGDGRKVRKAVPLVYQVFGGIPIFLSTAMVLAGSFFSSFGETLYLLALLSLLLASAFQFANIVMMYITPWEDR